MMEDHDTPEHGDCFDCGAHYEGFGETPPCNVCRILKKLRKPQRIMIFTNPDPITWRNFLLYRIKDPSPIEILKNTMWGRVGDTWTKCPDNCPDPFHPKSADPGVDTKDSNTKNLK